jgi:hypothetical protein
MASDHETIFTMEATPVKFGTGASADAGWELRRLGVKRAMLVTDPGVAALGHPQRIKGLIEAEGIEVVVYDRARVEPTVDSFQPDILRELMQDIAAPRGVAELGYTEDDIPRPRSLGRHHRCVLARDGARAGLRAGDEGGRVRPRRRTAARSNATVVTGHDPDAWPTFKHSPEAHD